MIRTEEDFETAMLDAFESGQIGNGNGLDDVRSSLSFENASLLTTDRGIVVRMLNGAEFQLTIVRSKAPNKE